MQFETIVGNIGTVYSGASIMEAELVFEDYRRQSLEREAGND